MTFGMTMMTLDLECKSGALDEVGILVLTKLVKEVLAINPDDYIVLIGWALG